MIGVTEMSLGLAKDVVISIHHQFAYWPHETNWLYLIYKCSNWPG